MTSVFVGREDILTNMAQWLRLDRRGRNGVAIYTLCGIGGVGKTELAREYANRTKTDLDAVLWVVAEKKELLSAEFSHIATQLHLDGAKIDGDAANNRRLVQDWFRTAGELSLYHHGSGPPLHSLSLTTPSSLGSSGLPAVANYLKRLALDSIQTNPGC